MPQPSRIYSPYRALGFVSSHVPLSMRYIERRKENLVVTAVGKCFHTYGCDKLTLLSVSNPHPDEIDCLASDSYLVFTASKNIIYAWRRGTELEHVYRGHEKNVHLLLPFGPHLLSVDEDSTLIVWDIKSEDIMLEMPFAKKSFCISALLHPSTYLNKILLGSKKGNLQLWNLKTTQLIFEFDGWKSPVTVLEQAPAVDVVAIGLASGDIYVHNLKYNKIIVKFLQEWGPVTAISFCSNKDGHPLMSTGSPIGHIAVWDLEKQKLHSEIRDAHRKPVTGMKFLPNEPLLVTSSADNTLKMWIFDLPDDGGRLLRLREGHSEPPSKIRFYGSSGRSILSTGSDCTLRSFSTIGDNFNKSLGQALYNRKVGWKKSGMHKHMPGKLPPITDFSSETTREKDWDNIVACHRELGTVTTWTFDRSRMGEHKLLHKTSLEEKNEVALCVVITSCGNFVAVGYDTGRIHKFNIQSGLHRGTYKIEDKAHNGSVRGVVCDELNQILTSGGSDKKLRFWRFSECALLDTLTLPFSICQMILHRESYMIAVAMDNFTIVIVNQENRRIVRTFEEHNGQIADMAFNADSRWLTVASMDSTIKTWDLPTGNLLDCFLVSPACVSLTVSPSSDFLATVHAEEMGIFLWFNTTLHSPMSLRSLPRDYEPQLMSLPTVSLQEDQAESSDANQMDVDGVNNGDISDHDEPEFKSADQIADHLVTLSLLPSSCWKNLLNLDIIKMHNKPKEPVKIAKNAPFFLPVVSGLKPTFDISEEDGSNKTDDSKIARLMQHGSAFTELLAQCEETESYEYIILKLKSMTLSMIDVEVRCLAPDDGGSVDAMLCFMKAMNYGLTTHRNFELVQSYLGLFLQIHGRIISETEVLCCYLKLLQENQTQSWTSLQKKFDNCLSIVNYLRSATL